VESDPILMQTKKGGQFRVSSAQLKWKKIGDTLVNSGTANSFSLRLRTPNKNPRQNYNKGEKSA
jgi:hypothetical protein